MILKIKSARAVRILTGTAFLMMWGFTLSAAATQAGDDAFLDHHDRFLANGIGEQTGGDLLVSSNMVDPSEKPLSDDDIDFPDRAGADEGIPDPLEPWNRAMFDFNDWFYFAVFKPVAEGYNFVMPELFRVSFRNFFHNVAVPVRFTSSILQGKPKKAGIELSRFVINTTVGFGGLFDIASLSLNLEVKDEEDIGQVLGSYGVGHGFYFILPFLGPLSLRDTFGLAGDYALDPVTYLFLVAPVGFSEGVQSFSFVNEGSLFIGEYESFKDAAFDPYTSMKDAYYQRRKYQIEN